MFTCIKKEDASGLGVRNMELCAVEYFGGRIGLCGPAVCRVRRPPPILVLFLLREFGMGKAVFKGSMQDIGWGICCLISGFLIFG